MCNMKNAYRRVMVLVAVIVALIALPGSEAQAAPVTECTGTIGAEVIEGVIVVPDGATCELLGTTLTQSVKVGVGSTLVARGITVTAPGSVNIQAYGATWVEVTGLGGGVPEEPQEQPSDLLGSIQAIAGGTVIISNTKVGGMIQIENNSGEVRIKDSFSEGAVELGKNRNGVSVEASFLGEGVEISETTGDVTFNKNTSDESDLTISKTNGDVTVRNNPSLGENFEVSETSGHVSVLFNIINDNADLSHNSGGLIFTGNTVGDNLAMEKIKGEQLWISDNIVGDNISVLEAGGDVTFTRNQVEGAASIDKTTGRVTASDNSIGFQPPEPPEPPAVPELPSGGSLTVSEASGGAIVEDNTVTGDLEVSENLSGTTVSDNTVRDGIAVSKNKGGTQVSDNRAGGDIECWDNDPAATGGGNVAGAEGGSGSLKGECAGPSAP